MSVAGLQDLPLEIFSGLVTDLAASDLPPGASPAQSDIAFILGAALTRPGLGTGAAGLTGFAGNPTVNYLKTFTDLQGNNRLLFLDSLGVFRQEFPQGTLAVVINPLQKGVPGSRAASATQFGREYIAFSDGKSGVDIPRQWDTTNYDRVSQCGPGQAPFAADGGSAVQNIASITQPAAVVIGPTPGSIEPGLIGIPNGNIFVVGHINLIPGEKITIAGVDDATYDQVGAIVASVFYGFIPFLGANGTQIDYSPGNTPGTFSSENGTFQSQTATVVTPTPHGLVVGQALTIAGTVGGTYDGAFVVFSVIDQFTFTFIMATAGNAAGGAVGTITTAGHIPAGIHQVTVFFVTRQGYLTKPAPPTKWTAAGNQTVLVSGIPTGPPNVIARILAFTTAAGATFFYIASDVIASSNMIVNDNVTTTARVDFNDTILAAGQDISNLFNLLELGECAGVIAYSSRLFWWGERNKVQNILNFTFDGGFAGPMGAPLGWTLDPVNGTGFQQATSLIWGGAGEILGDGATAIRGMITQNVAFDYLGAAILAQSTAYSVRVRLQSAAPLAQGGFKIELYSPGLATSYGIFSVTFAQINALAAGQVAEFSGPLAAAITPIPSDLQIRVYMDGTPSNAAGVIFDNIEVFPTKQPVNTTQVRASYAEDPESYDGLTGFLNVAPENGQATRAAFVLREKLYFVKERSMYATEDDGQNEPSLWSLTEISNKVGTFSVQGVDVGEEWAMIAARQGLYIFWGPEPVKVSQEVQSLWNSINWTAGQTIWVRVDDVNKRVLVGVPIGAAVSPNRVFMFDYRGIDTAQEIADHWTVRYSSYTGKILAIGNAPKWCPWTMTINAAALVERNDGTAHIFMGNGAGTGKIYDLLDPQQPGSGGVYSDDGAGIPWTYSTYYVPGHMDEQALHLGAHRKLFGYLTGLVEGSGQMDISAQPIGNTSPIPLLSIQLVNVGAPAAVTQAVRTLGTTQITCAAGHGLQATDTQAVLAGLGDPSVDGTFPILQILDPQNFTIAQPYLADIAPLGAGGTVTRLLRDFEMATNITAERVSYTFSNHGNAPGSWFKIEKLIPSLSSDPWGIVRGGN